MMSKALSCGRESFFGSARTLNASGGSFAEKVLALSNNEAVMDLGE